VSIYDTYGENGWAVYGGTSESTPFNAGIFGLAGNADKQDGGKIFWTLKKHALKKDLWVISSGSDGSCTPTYLCTAGTGEYKTYSGPAGWGTPNGIGAY
jgi:subtilase family serine protease